MSENFKKASLLNNDHETTYTESIEESLILEASMVINSMTKEEQEENYLNKLSNSKEDFE